MSEDRHTSREQNDIEIRSVNEDSPGIETMPEITPEMISPNPPKATVRTTRTINQGHQM